MKNFLVVLVLSFCFAATHATTYYFAANGNDANNGTSTSTPFKTLNKFNSLSLNAGDNIFFNRGDVFYGSISVNRSGTSSAPITFGAYGSGVQPIITGFNNVTAWTNSGNNIWESTTAVSSLPDCNMVLIDGVNVAMGRYPNTGYLVYQSASSNKSITSSSIGSTDWTGAEAVIRKNDWILDRCAITGQSGSTLNYSDPYNKDVAVPGYGFFIQNDSRTLDQQNEWYYNPSTKKLRIYSSTSPSHVQLATVPTLFSSNSGYVAVDNINFVGSSNDLMVFGGGNGHVQNCTISFAGQTAISLSGSNQVINNNKISNSNRGGIENDGGNANTITNNVILNSGVIKGQAYNASQGAGIVVASTNAVIKYNTIRGTSYNGISVSSLVGTLLVQYNVIDSTSQVLDDAGGIYTTSADAGIRTFDHNIITNGIGNREGTNKPTNFLSIGIYLDELSSNVVVSNNSIANCSNAGIKIHKGHSNSINNNTVYNCAIWQMYFQNATSASAIYSNILSNNIFFARTATEWVLGFVSVSNDISGFGTADNNYYARPIDDNATLSTYQSNTNYVNRTLTGWQSSTRQDAHSHKSPKTITSVSDLRFEFNPTKANKTITLDGNYIDVKNVSYNGTITLAPYTSAILIRNSGATTN